MNLPGLAVKRPVTTLMVFLALLVFGIVSLTRINLDMLPEITPPGISVIVPYPGASASDVESDVVEYLEDTLSTVNNLDHLVSVAKDNVAVITCQFTWGTNLDVASSDIRDKIDLTKTDLAQHAPDALEPFLFKFTSAIAPILFISVQATESWEQLYHIVDTQIADSLRRVEGVGAIIIYGGLRRQINVFFDKQKLEAFHLPLEAVIQALAQENLDMPVGSVKMGWRDYHLRVPGRFKSAEEIGSVIVAAVEGRPVYLRDIATVEDAFEEQKMKSWSNGKNSVLLIVQKQSGTNTVAVVRRVRQRLEEVKPALPADVSISIPTDNSEFIVHSLQNLARTLLVAGVLVLIITFIFLRRLAPTLIIATVIPFTLIISFIYLFVRDLTINLISMMSLSVCIGMVVDNAIVVLENITRRVDEGEKPVEAAVFGASEMGTAITASTLTTIVVFAPLIFVTGIAGIVFKQLGAIVAIALGGSLLTALTLTPMLGARFIRPQANRSSGNGVGKIFAATERLYARLERRYGKILGYALDHRVRILAVLVCVFVATLGLVRFIGSELFPVVDVGEIETVVQLDESARLEESERVALKMASILTELVPERRSYYAWAGETEAQFGVALGMAEGANVAQAGAKLVDKRHRDRSDKEIADMLRKEMRAVPGIQKMDVSTASMMRMVIMGGAKPLLVEIAGRDRDEITRIANELRDAVEKVSGAVDVTTTERLPRSEMWVVVDREKAAQLGVSTAAVARTLRANYYGYEATKFRDAGDDFDVFLRLNDDERGTLDDIGDVTVASRTGRLVALKNIARIEPAQGPIWIDRKDRQRIISVEADTFGRSLGEVKADVQRLVDKLDVPPGVTITFAGQVEEQREAFRDLRLLLVVGIALVYMIMASQFESLKTPFVIMFSVPFAFTGVIWALAATGLPITIVALIGLVLLMGVVVNNAIVLVDYTNILRQRGFGLREAILTASTRRLRPVLMTAATTVFAMIPVALGTGEGSEMWQPFGYTVMGGLSVATLVTLLLIPMVYSIVEGYRKDRGTEGDVEQ